MLFLAGGVVAAAILLAIGLKLALVSATSDVSTKVQAVSADVAPKAKH